MKQNKTLKYPGAEAGYLTWTTQVPLLSVILEHVVGIGVFTLTTSSSSDSSILYVLSECSRNEGSMCFQSDFYWTITYQVTQPIGSSCKSSAASRHVGCRACVLVLKGTVQVHAAFLGCRLASMYLIHRDRELPSLVRLPTGSPMALESVLTSILNSPFPWVNGTWDDFHVLPWVWWAPIILPTPGVWVNCSRILASHLFWKLGWVICWWHFFLRPRRGFCHPGSCILLSLQMLGAAGVGTGGVLEEHVVESLGFLSV